MTVLTHPVTTTGLDVPDLSAATGFGDDGVYVVSVTAGGSITMNATNFIVSSFNTSFNMDPERTDEGNNDGLMVYMTGATNDIINAFLNLGEGCVISNTPRFGIQNPYGGAVTIAGAADNRVIFNNIHSDAIWCYSDSSGVTQATTLSVDECVINNVDGTACKEQETAGRGFVTSVTNTIITNCGGPAIELYSSGTEAPTMTSRDVVISNVTIDNCGFDADPGTDYDLRACGIGSPTYQSTNASDRNVDISDTIISGCNTGIYNSGTGTYTVDYVGLYALTAQTGGTVTLGSNVITENPAFYDDSASLFASANYYDVTNRNYQGAGSGGSDLVGGAAFMLLTSANSWSIYQ